MVKAFIMIKLGTSKYKGLTETALEKISKVPSVKRVYPIFGRYDMIAEVEAKSLSELSRLTQDNLKDIPEIRFTETFICHE